MNEQLTPEIQALVESQVIDDKVKNTYNSLLDMKVDASELSEIASKIGLAEDLF